MEIDDHGLTSLLDDTVQPECQKILAEMEPRKMPLKQKSVSFVDQQGNKSVRQTTISSPTQSRFQTKPVAIRQDDESNKVGSKPSLLQFVKMTSLVQGESAVWM
jgi:hypothetical protein